MSYIDLLKRSLAIAEARLNTILPYNPKIHTSVEVYREAVLADQKSAWNEIKSIRDEFDALQSGEGK